jgi:hypothetical protein
VSSNLSCHGAPGEATELRGRAAASHRRRWVVVGLMAAVLVELARLVIVWCSSARARQVDIDDVATPTGTPSPPPTPTPTRHRRASTSTGNGDRLAQQAAPHAAGGSVDAGHRESAQGRLLAVSHRLQHEPLATMGLLPDARRPRRGRPGRPSNAGTSGPSATRPHLSSTARRRRSRPTSSPLTRGARPVPGSAAASTGRRTAPVRTTTEARRRW